MTAPRSERTRVIANLGWLGGVVQVALGAALFATPEAPLVAATLALLGGAGMVLAGTLVLGGARASSAVATTAFAVSIGAAAYVAWIAAPYWRGAAVTGGLAVCGLIAESTQRRTVPAGQRSAVGGGGSG
ncbi:hypothetical protein [Agromyces sp. ZXT2-6]|uniref:hypothetical protein n=1 Tax=Agromyces sp. ZXT2-6 TaxID=3461153 RepID=UPI0040550791